MSEEAIDFVLFVARPFTSVHALHTHQYLVGRSLVSLRSLQKRGREKKIIVLNMKMVDLPPPISVSWSHTGSSGKSFILMLSDV